MHKLDQRFTTERQASSCPSLLYNSKRARIFGECGAVSLVEKERLSSFVTQGLPSGDYAVNTK
jgi:hypothetical protein